ncbi:triose-phosphate isomerase [Candidatus Woesearchaeota archaeon]|nr:triose-phosphate isomerase [Candidatus Woesearchaeota archaeon]
MLNRLLRDGPVLIINLKTYDKGTSIDALKVAVAAERAAEKTGKKVILAAQPTDILLITNKTKIPVIAQHIDCFEQGAHTGSISAEAVLRAGAIGTLLNHSEKQISKEDIAKTMKICKSHGLFVVLCADTPEHAYELSKNTPNFIAIEPPELIGTGKSISEVEPELIDKTIRLVSKNCDSPVICGAGVSTKKDVIEAFKHGVKGILVSSAVVKSDNPYNTILELLAGF